MTKPQRRDRNRNSDHLYRDYKGRALGINRNGPPIPDGSLPTDLRALYGKDLTEWAGFNASPNFAYTGRLTAAGWNARPDSTPLNYVEAACTLVP